MTRVGPSRQHSHPLAGRPRSMALAQPRRIPVLVRGTSDFEPYPDRAPDATDAVNDEIEKLDIIVPDSLVKRFTVAAQAWQRSGDDNSEFYERWMEFTADSKRFLGTD
jgi:hypothetical protein